jgi:hypothetical protein
VGRGSEYDEVVDTGVAGMDSMWLDHRGFEGFDFWIEKLRS